MKLHDAYLSVHEALKHAGIHHGCARQRALARRGGDVARGGRRGAGGGRRRAHPRRLRVSRLGREDPRLPRRPRARDPVPRDLPRACTSRSPSSRATSWGSPGANSTEMDPETPYPVIDLLPEQKEIEDLGGTMRLGAQAVELVEGTRARESVRRAGRAERHRHRYEVNNHFRPGIERGRARRLGDVPGRAARRDHRAARSPVVRREPVPSGVQVTADAARAALPRVRRAQPSPAVGRAEPGQTGPGRQPPPSAPRLRSRCGAGRRRLAVHRARRSAQPAGRGAGGRRPRRWLHARRSAWR